MDPDSRRLLEENLKLAQENNEMLHEMRRSMRVARFMTYVYWIFIVGSAVGAYYIIQPYIDQLYNIYGGAKSNIDSFNTLLQNFNKKQ